MKVEVSLGEAIDKLSILELKIIKITDESKNAEIKKEINALTECQAYKIKYELYYNMLMYVNEKIWDLTDIIKSITTEHSNFACISNQIFEFNQKRFRIKNWFNLLTNSDIKEQKSYSSSCCNIIIESEELFFNKLPEINYLAIEYDIITIQSPIITIIQDFLKIPTIIYDEDRKKRLNPTTINLSEFVIPSSSEIRDFFSAKPIKYVIGGLFGDFIQCLSIINEKFYETGRKGILYISNTKGDRFRNGVENTYNDTYPVIIKQNYIHEFKLHNNQQFDIDLSYWRKNPNLFKQTLYNTFIQTYNVKWGKRQWLNVPIDDKWKNKIIINTTSYRFSYSINFKLLQELYSDDLVFISSSKNEYIFFKEKTNINVNYYEFSSFLELSIIINSCKFFVGSLSAPLSIAHALHKERICGLPQGKEDTRMSQGLDIIFTNLRYSV
jgi:hypothetical protein